MTIIADDQAIRVSILRDHAEGLGMEFKTRSRAEIGKRSVPVAVAALKVVLRCWD